MARRGGGNLTVDPGKYQVVWTLPTTGGATVQLPGDVSLQPDLPPRGSARGEALTLFEVPVPGIKYASFPQSLTADLVVGQAVNGFWVALFDVQIEVWIGDQISLLARAALAGRQPWPSDGTDIAAFDLQIEGLDAIAGAHPILSTGFPSLTPGTDEHLTGSWEATANPASTQMWSDADTTIALRFPWSMSPPNGFFFRVTFSPVLEVTLSTPIGLDDVFRLWVEPLRRIVSLGTSRQEKLTYVTVQASGQAEEGPWFQVFGTAIHQAPYSSDSNVRIQAQPSFLLSPLDMSPLLMLRRWQAQASEHHPLLETYAAMMYATAQHPRNRLLLLLQALEGLDDFHRRELYETRSAQLRERRQAVIDEAETNGLDPESIKFLKETLPRRPFTGLDSSLRRTLASLPVDLGTQLEESDLFREVRAGPHTPTSALDALRMVRNDLAHGVRGYGTHALSVVADLLEHAVRAHLLRLLGCTDDTLERELRRS